MSEDKMPRLDMSYEIIKEQWEDFKTNILSQINEIKENIRRLSDEQRVFLKLQNDIELKREKQIAEINLEIMSQKKDCDKCRSGFQNRIETLEKAPERTKSNWQFLTAILFGLLGVIISAIALFRR
ncbi:MAG: hypothetical protein HGB12_00255 [Bacteroidetes bacterium]|nr:hypothetical protein [Bacteroidota bacterium]